MSGLYLPGMELPVNCSSCKFKHETYWLSRNVCIADDMREIHVNLNTARDDNCPLVPVPDHGDLKTNYDRITQSPEELARFISAIADRESCEKMHGYRMCDAAPEKLCVDCWLDWLKQVET